VFKLKSEGVVQEVQEVEGPLGIFSDVKEDTSLQMRLKDGHPHPLSSSAQGAESARRF
jgi:hypothetical protein